MKAPDWPTRVVGEINQISDRAAMGLPEHYVSPRVEITPDMAKTVMGCGRDELVSLVEDATAALAKRIAAGCILSLIGDPRIDVLNPPMVKVAAGRATLGTDHASIDELMDRYGRFGVKRAWIEKECPRFSVEIGEFALARYPVTNTEYLAFLEATRFEELPSSWAYGKAPSHAMNVPVHTVSPLAADAYARWLSGKTGRRFRLPTEYEWEFAAAGGQGTRFPWGDEFRADCANTMEIGLLNASPIGAFPLGATSLGILDLAGNVEEYVSDSYRPYPGGALVKDDLYLKLGNYRIARGGAFNRFSDLARCQRRHGAYPSSLYAIGFRLAEDI